MWQPSLQMGEFISDFKPGGKYDQKSSNPIFSKGYLNYEGEVWQYDDFGNYAFGYAGAVLGIDLGSLIEGAGLVQMWTGNPDWSNFRGFFDNSNDTPLIRRGYNDGKKK